MPAWVYTFRQRLKITDDILSQGGQQRSFQNLAPIQSDICNMTHSSLWWCAIMLQELWHCPKWRMHSKLISHWVENNIMVKIKRSEKHFYHSLAVFRTSEDLPFPARNPKHFLHHLHNDTPQKLWHTLLFWKMHVQLLYQNTHQKDFDIGSFHSFRTPPVDGFMGNSEKTFCLLVAQICFSLSLCRYWKLY